MESSGSIRGAESSQITDAPHSRADIQSKGSGRASHDALTQVHARRREFVLHLDIDVIAVEEFPAVNVRAAAACVSTMCRIVHRVREAQEPAGA